MKFKVGQRVRKVRHHDHGLIPTIPIGTEGIILHTSHPNPICRGGYVVVYPGWTDAQGYFLGDRPGLRSLVAGFNHTLVPLTDPKADAFIEAVKSWKPEPVIPLPVKIASYSGWKVKS